MRLILLSGSYWLLPGGSGDARIGSLEIGLAEPAMSRFNWAVKRGFDLVMSVLLLIILSPLIIGVGLLIKLDSRGPVFFCQQRIGKGGRVFWMLKFRTMVEGAERQESWLMQSGADGQLLFAKTPDDSRVTRLGRLLRRTSLDELPQLFNVVKGDMSLVGPRPELPWLAAQYEAWQRQRFAVPQGMTGWWQVNGRMKRAHLRERVEDDLFYIQHYSLWLDLHILLKTVLAVIRGEGAY